MPCHSDENQEKIVRGGGLPVLVPLLRSSNTETVTAAVAALRNLSIHKGNEVNSCLMFRQIGRVIYQLR